MDSCKQYFTAEKILTIPSIYIYEIIKLVLHSPVTTKEDVHTYNTRNKTDLTINTFRLNIFKINIDYMGPKIINHLPDRFKKLSNNLIKQRQIKNWLLEKTFYTLEDYFLNDE